MCAQLFLLSRCGRFLNRQSRYHLLSWQDALLSWPSLLRWQSPLSFRGGCVVEGWPSGFCRGGDGSFCGLAGGRGGSFCVSAGSYLLRATGCLSCFPCPSHCLPRDRNRAWRLGRPPSSRSLDGVALERLEFPLGNSRHEMGRNSRWQTVVGSV